MDTLRERIPLTENFGYEVIHFLRRLKVEEIADAILGRSEHAENLHVAEHLSSLEMESSNSNGISDPGYNGSICSRDR